MFSSVISSFEPLIIGSSLLGFILFTIDIKKSTAVINFWNFLSIFSTIVINLIIICYLWNFKIFNEIMITEIGKASMPFMMDIDHFLFIFIFIWNFLKRHKIVKFFKLLAEIDEDLTKFGLKFDYKRQQKFLTFVIICIIIVTPLMIVFGSIVQANLGINFGYAIILIVLWLFFLGLIYITFFTTSMKNIGIRFEMLNFTLEHHQNLSLSKVHLKVVETVKIFNNIFGIPMMLCFGNLFAFNCLTAFSFAMMPKEFFGFGVIASMIFNFSFTSGSLFLIINTADKTGKAKENLIEILYKMANENDKNYEKIQNFVMQAKDLSVEFSCGFFDFNWKMLFKFISAGVMYFIILLQFEPVFKSSKNYEFVNFNNSSY
ncbi:hypothetical protein PVAND_017138 [Polypedilum vanderplanki]|uniref:Gustatory receptor n=1 Tax=Polypedilum vanderplanki TaxID=319348 RepID=A0A9J6BIJ5_POLVA|nr:hypothetical protein PVAND_017138 [Polypedilum vanderplanki]